MHALDSIDEISIGIFIALPHEIVLLSLVYALHAQPRILCDCILCKALMGSFYTLLRATIASLTAVEHILAEYYGYPVTELTTAI